jgi:hypothetical protein
MASVESFLERRLKLKINRQKSQVARPRRRKFLGFSFTSGTDPKLCVAPQALNRFKARVRGLPQRTGGKSLVQTVEDLSPYVTGWRDTSASAKRARCCETSIAGSGAGSDPSSGNRGNEAERASTCS